MPFTVTIPARLNRQLKETQMGKKVRKHQDVDPEFVEAVRLMANPITGMAHEGKTEIRSDVIHILRDGHGNVISSEERIEMTDISNADKSWYF
jgi:hypothetical protein